MVRTVGDQPGLWESILPPKALMLTEQLAAIEIIEWPVALVVGAGSSVAERVAHQDAEKIAAWRPVPLTDRQGCLGRLLPR